METNEKCLQTANLHLHSSDYPDIETYEKDLKELAKNIETFVKESNFLQDKEYVPSMDQHLTRLERAERAIEELTNRCAYNVCHLLF